MGRGYRENKCIKAFMSLVVCICLLVSLNVPLVLQPLYADPAPESLDSHAVSSLSDSSSELSSASNKPTTSSDSSLPNSLDFETTEDLFSVTPTSILESNRNLNIASSVLETAATELVPALVPEGNSLSDNTLENSALVYHDSLMAPDEQIYFKDFVEFSYWFNDQRTQDPVVRNTEHVQGELLLYKDLHVSHFSTLWYQGNKSFDLTIKSKPNDQPRVYTVFNDTSERLFQLRNSSPERLGFTVHFADIILDGQCSLDNGKEIDVSNNATNNVETFGGAAVWVGQNTEIVLDSGSVIQNCYTTAGSSGGAIYLEDCPDNIDWAAFIQMHDGAVIQNCRAVQGGGVFLGSGSDGLFDGGVIRDCSAVTYVNIMAGQPAGGSAIAGGFKNWSTEAAYGTKITLAGNFEIMNCLSQKDSSISKSTFVFGPVFLWGTGSVLEIRDQVHIHDNLVRDMGYKKYTENDPIARLHATQASLAGIAVYEKFGEHDRNSSLVIKGSPFVYNNFADSWDGKKWVRKQRNLTSINDNQDGASPIDILFEDVKGATVGVTNFSYYDPYTGRHVLSNPDRESIPFGFDKSSFQSKPKAGEPLAAVQVGKEFGGANIISDADPKLVGQATSLTIQRSSPGAPNHLEANELIWGNPVAKVMNSDGPGTLRVYTALEDAVNDARNCSAYVAQKQSVPIEILVPRLSIDDMIPVMDVDTTITTASLGGLSWTHPFDPSAGGVEYLKDASSGTEINIPRAVVERNFPKNPHNNLFNVTKGVELALRTVTLDGLKDSNANNPRSNAGRGHLLWLGDASRAVLAQDALLRNNRTLDDFGGAVKIEESSSFTMKDNAAIENCESDRGGGAVAVLDGSMTMTDSSTLKENKATNGGRGGAVYVEAQNPKSSAVLTLSGSPILTKNSAEQGKGGALYLTGNPKLSSVRVIGGELPENDPKIYNNTALRGGGVAMDGGLLTTEGENSLLITENRATESGSGMYIAGGSATLTNAEIIRNYISYADEAKATPTTMGAGIILTNKDGQAAQAPSLIVSGNTQIRDNEMSGVGNINYELHRGEHAPRGNLFIDAGDPVNTFVDMPRFSVKEPGSDMKVYVLGSNNDSTDFPSNVEYGQIGTALPNDGGEKGAAQENYSFNESLLSDVHSSFKALTTKDRQIVWNTSRDVTIRMLFDLPIGVPIENIKTKEVDFFVYWTQRLEPDQHVYLTVNRANGSTETLEFPHMDSARGFSYQVLNFTLGHGDKVTIPQVPQGSSVFFGQLHFDKEDQMEFERAFKQSTNERSHELPTVERISPATDTVFLNGTYLTSNMRFDNKGTTIRTSRSDAAAVQYTFVNRPTAWAVPTGLELFGISPWWLLLPASIAALTLGAIIVRRKRVHSSHRSLR